MKFYNLVACVLGVIVIFATSSRCQDPFLLECNFDRQVPVCGWLHNGLLVTIPSSGYNFAAGAKQFGTTSCSLQFTFVDPKVDKGNWDCVYKPTLFDKHQEWQLYHVAFVEDPKMKPPKVKNSGNNNHHCAISYVMIALLLAIYLSPNAGL